MKKYQRNQNYVVSGETFNEIADAVNWTQENQARLNGPDAFNKSFQNGEIRIKYLDSGTLPIFSAVALTGLAITPRDSKFTYNTPTLNANKVTTSNEKCAFAICAEPANNGKLTKAVLNGVVPAKVTIKDATHDFAKPTVGGSGTLESCEAGTARIIWKAGNSGTQWCILQLGAGGAGGSEYNGYFKIVNASTTSEGGQTSNKIKIVDGATYDSTGGTSGKSVCKVNNAVFQIDPFSADVSGTKTYVLTYTAGTRASGSTPATEATVEIVALDSMPSDTKTNAYYQIGRAIVSNGQMKIQQDHTAGVAQIYWYLLCSEDEE